MAFLALLGVGISAWAVWLLKKTLDATRIAIREGEKATAVAQAVGEAQVRAYLHCNSATYHLSKGTMGAKIKIANTGSSPASHIEVSGELTVNDIGGFPSHPRVTRWLTSDTSTGVCYPIPARSDATAEIDFFSEFSFPQGEEWEDESFRKDIFDTGNQIWFDTKIKWHDVFRKQHEFRVSLVADIDASPYSPKKKRGRTGKLQVLVEEDAIHLMEQQAPGDQG